MPAPLVPTVGHVGLNVTDLDRSLAFYQGLFALDVAATSPDPDHRWALLAGGGRIVLTLWEQAGAGHDGSRAGLHHLAFAVDGPAEVAAAEARLRALGVEPLHGGPVPIVDGREGLGLFFTDPDGTRLEVSSASGHAEAEAPFGPAPSCGFF